MINKLFRPARKSGTGIRIHFLGAARSVTGSFHFFEYEERGKTIRFFVDAGSIQDGDKTSNTKNRLPKGLKAKDINFGIISHDHNDHTGELPALYKDGFRGSVYCTRATKDLAELTLLDGGHIQEERARQENELLRAQGKKKRARILPRYTQDDAASVLKQIKGLNFRQRFTAAKNVTVEFLPSSHLLGAAQVVMWIGDGESKRKIVFSGDIGRVGMACLQDMEQVADADYIICESTYGDKLHPKRSRLDALADVINRAFGRAKILHKVDGAGKILIPVFAVGRAQAVLYDLSLLMAQGRIPKMKVSLDSPLAIKATEIYRRHVADFPKADRKRAERADLFRTPNFTECLKKSQSLRLAKPSKEPEIILSSSGMANGGRVLDHLKNLLPGRNNTVVFVGHQADGTNGAALTGGAEKAPAPKSICIDEGWVNVLAQIELMEDYSGHGDYEDIMNWLSGFKRKASKIFLVHGEEGPAMALKSRIEETLGVSTVVPTCRSCYELA